MKHNKTCGTPVSNHAPRPLHARPSFTLNLFLFFKLFNLDFPGLPVFGCLARNSFISCFFIMVFGPMIIIGLLILYHLSGRLSLLGV